MEQIKQFIRDDVSTLEEIKDIANYGCEGGSLSALITVEDTHRFFDTYYSEITSYIKSYAELAAIPITEMMSVIVTTSDIKQDVSRFIAQHAAREIYCEEMGLH